MEGAGRFGIELGSEQLAQFERYRAALLEWNQRFNLTAITEPDEVDRLHFVDSLACLLVRLPAGARLLDVGAGAGFPGLPLKIARPDLRLTLLEATGKKCRFLEHVVETLGLSGVEVVNDRAESAAAAPAKPARSASGKPAGRAAKAVGTGVGQAVHAVGVGTLAGAAAKVVGTEGWREQFDVVVARALAPLPALLELTLPFAVVGGLLLAQKKGAGLQAEVATASHALDILGGQLQEPRAYQLDEPGGQGEERQIVVVRKVRAAPPEYPRRPGMPAKHPL